MQEHCQWIMRLQIWGWIELPEDLEYGGFPEMKGRNLFLAQSCPSLIPVQANKNCWKNPENSKCMTEKKARKFALVIF